MCLLVSPQNFEDVEAGGFPFFGKFLFDAFLLGFLQAFGFEALGVGRGFVHQLHTGIAVKTCGDGLAAAAARIADFAAG